MIEVLGNFTTEDDVDEEKALLLHAHLACLLHGLDAGHIDNHAFDALRRELRANLQAAGLTDAGGVASGAMIRAEPMWTLFVDAVTKASEQQHPSGRKIALADTRKSDPDFCGRDLVTIGRLEFQSELAQRGAKALRLTHLRKISRADIVRKASDRAAQAAIVECCNQAIRLGSVKPTDFLKGYVEAITWVTPVEDRARELLNRADHYGLTKADISDLRDLLGLWAENGLAKRPLAAFFLDCRAGLAAPNVFTAQGYERFRHRPVESIPKSPNSGLTYNLDRRNAVRHPGASEIVADAIAMTQIKRIAAGGQPKRFRSGRDAALESHRQYSEDVHRGQAIADILLKLDARP